MGNFKKSLFISLSIFFIQVLSLIIISHYYPPDLYRTGIFTDFTYSGIKHNFLLGAATYYPFLSFILGMFLIDYLINQGKIILKNVNISIDIKRWDTFFRIDYALIFSILIYSIILLLLRIYGIIESIEPLIVTLIWTIDDILGIFISTYYILFGYNFFNYISEIIFSLSDFNIYNPDKYGGWGKLKDLIGIGASSIGFINGLFLIPWILTLGPIQSLYPFITQLLMKTSIIFFIFIIIIYPISMFTYLSHILKERVSNFKLDKFNEINNKYNEINNKILNILITEEKTNIEELIQKYNYMSKMIEEISNINEWPFNVLNITLLITSTFIQVIQILIDIF